MSAGVAVLVGEGPGPQAVLDDGLYAGDRPTDDWWVRRNWLVGVHSEHKKRISIIGSSTVLTIPRSSTATGMSSGLI